MPRTFLTLALILLFATPVLCAPAVSAGSSPPIFPAAAHDDAAIEWWYFNAHVTTANDRHFAVVGSFFKFGDGTSPIDHTTPLPRSHYLIYAVTDLDKNSQRSYSLADSNMMASLKMFAPFMAVSTDPKSQALLAALMKNQFPKPHQLFAGAASVVNSPFHIAYGDSVLDAANDTNTSFTISLDSGGRDKIKLTLTSTKPSMAVGGMGDTGLSNPTDMHYFSLTRCGVTGQIDTGAGPEQIANGQGWFDHQWGSSWVTQNNGWDWWGVQLENGSDILFWRQRDLATGKIFFPLATFMDKNGRQTVTRNIVFLPDRASLWRSPVSGVTYPMHWKVEFPDKNLMLWISADPKEQEIPILGPGGSIWEGNCFVVATKLTGTKKPDIDMWLETIFKDPPPNINVAGWRGVAYMELVGYNSPAVKAQFAEKPVKPRKK